MHSALFFHSDCFVCAVSTELFAVCAVCNITKVLTNFGCNVIWKFGMFALVDFCTKFPREFDGLLTNTNPKIFRCRRSARPAFHLLAKREFEDAF